MAVPEHEHFRETWSAWRKHVDLSRIDTEVFRIGWAKPTIYREHEVIHVMANALDQSLALNKVYRDMLIAAGCKPEMLDSIERTVGET